ncbi:MAG: tryptophan synthase subunit alpha [Proteobacteria bacterium]|nr:tryptophan synthase subunit alpha [Pseudomonadota bacterium]
MTDDARGKLDAMFARATEQGRCALLPYLTAGIPDADASVEIFAAMAEAGADGFEVGIPYADPLMDGPVIMAAGEAALDRGITVEVAMDIISRVVERTGKPVLAMTYVNPVLRHGVEDFFQKAVVAGASGVIIADLPVNEAEPFLAAAAAAGIGLVLFAAPTTDDARLDAVVASDPVFLYAVAEVGVTGERSSASENIAGLAFRIRSRGNVPIVFGVGISTPDHVAHAAPFGDGVIVGTAIVRRVLDAASGEDAATEVAGFVGELALATKVRAT